jgi:hypothetical protein
MSLSLTDQATQAGEGGEKEGKKRGKREEKERKKRGKREGQLFN